ncbi:MAG: cell division protein ZapA [Oscillospiraceae bacterium]|nr:cell division protein ZapA [Oscillospiraceae bacterium]MDY3066210.1 cell division protein ZapA [Oscillospiraceae bacterium]
MNRIKIILAGKEYTIQTEESGSYVKQLAESLNKKIEEFMQANESVSMTSASMLVALGLMDDCIKASSDKDNLRKQVIDYLEEATRSRTEITELKKELDALREKNAMLEMKLLTFEGSGEDEQQTSL